MRRRPSVLVSASLALALSILPGVASQAVRAADSPEGAVNAVLDLLVAKEFDQMGPLVCEERREEILESLDLAQSMGGDGVDAQPLVDAMTLSIEGRSVSTLSEEGDEASVELLGTLVVTFDEAAAREWVRAALEATGQPTDDASVDQYLRTLVDAFSSGVPIDTQADVVRVDGEWLLCDDFQGEDDPDPSFDPDASFEPIENALCDLMTIEEINTLSPLVFATTVPTSDGCSWDSDFDATGAYYGLAIYLQEGTLSELAEVWGDGQELTIAGRPAWGNETATWVDIGDGELLAIQPVLFGAPDADQIDVVEFAAAAGEIVVPRLP